MKIFFSWRYWFEPLPGDPNLIFWRIIFAVAGLCLLLGVVAVGMARRHRHDGLKRRLWLRAATWGLTVGPMIYLFGFFRFQDAYFLSMRAWIFAWIGLSCVWLFFIVKFAAFELPKRIKARQEREQFNKYLPYKK